MFFFLFFVFALFFTTLPLHTYLPESAPYILCLMFVFFHLTTIIPFVAFIMVDIHIYDIVLLCLYNYACFPNQIFAFFISITSFPSFFCIIVRFFLNFPYLSSLFSPFLQNSFCAVVWFFVKFVEFVLCVFLFSITVSSNSFLFVLRTLKNYSTISVYDFIYFFVPLPSFVYFVVVFSLFWFNSRFIAPSLGGSRPVPYLGL